MEKVIDAIIEQINLIKDLDYDEGGFRDEIDLEEVWFDDPRILPSESYPFIYVAPGTSRKTNETTQFIDRTLTISVGLLVDPREFYDVDEVAETTASREMLRTVDAIERHFERKTLRLPNGLAENTVGLEVGETVYSQQLRGDLYGRSALITLQVVKRYPRID